MPANFRSDIGCHAGFAFIHACVQFWLVEGVTSIVANGVSIRKGVTGGYNQGPKTNDKYGVSLDDKHWVKVGESINKDCSYQIQETAGRTSDTEGEHDIETTNKGGVNEGEQRAHPIRLPSGNVQHDGRCGAVNKRSEYNKL